MSSHIYREYDIRGVADRDLTSAVCRRIGQGLGTLLRPPEKWENAENAEKAEKAKGRFRLAVGRDCRLSGPRISAELMAGLREAGADVVDIGVGPTPMLYFAVFHLGTDGGVMITGSHNPGDENGFKVMG